MAALFYDLMILTTAVGIASNAIYIIAMFLSTKKSEVLSRKDTWRIVRPAFRLIQWCTVLLGLIVWFVATGRPLEECLKWYDLIASTFLKLAIAWAICFAVVFVFNILYIVHNKGYNLRGAGCAIVMTDIYSASLKTAVILGILGFILRAV